MVRRPSAVGTLAALALAAGCGGGDGGQSTTSSQVTTGAGGSGGSGGETASTTSSTHTGGGGTGGAATVCVPGAAEACYTGPFGTEGVGICHGGSRTCASDGSGFGSCQGEVLPAGETCLTLEDDDCDGQVNEEGPGCVCIPGSLSTCYSGPNGTEGVGTCIAGLLTCLAEGTGYGPCEGEVVPVAEDCSTPLDEDCDGLTPLCPALWARRYGDAAGQFAWGLAVDASGGVVITGEIFGATDFGGGVKTSTGNGDVFVAKLDAQGAHVWSKIFGNSSVQSSHGVAIDAAGNVILVGYFQGSVTFGTTALSSSGGSDIYAAKFDASGNHVWSKKFGSSTDDQLGLAVAVDAAGNVLLTGALTGTMGFGGANLSSSGGSDVFVAKLDGVTGNHVWSKKFGDAALVQTGRALAVDSSGNVLVTGEFDGIVNFGGAAFTTAGGTDIFVAKLDGVTGNHQWSAAFGGTGWDMGRGVAADAAGRFVVVGDFQGTVNFGGGARTAKGNTDAFATLFDAAGGYVAGAAFGGLDYESSAAVASSGGCVVVTGYFEGNVDVGGTTLTTAGGRDVFVAKLSGADLTTTWARSFGDGAFYQAGQAVGLDASGNTLLAGYFFGAIDFGNGPLTSAGDADVFVAKLGP